MTSSFSYKPSDSVTQFYTQSFNFATKILSHYIKFDGLTIKLIGKFRPFSTHPAMCKLDGCVIPPKKLQKSKKTFKKLLT